MKLFSKKLTMKSYFNFYKHFRVFKNLSKEVVPRFEILWKDRYPCLKDNKSATSFDRHYVYHTAWAARVLAETKPCEHFDISSSLYFVSIVSAFVPIKFYDYRPPNLNLNNYSENHADLLALPFGDKSIKSISCMHVIEHIGLGRYGDPLDPEGDLKAISELKRVVAVGGTLLFVVPVGKPKIMFNAHRIYSFDQVLSYFSDLELMEFSLIPDGDSGLIRNATKDMADRQTFGCGCFWFVKS